MTTKFTFFTRNQKQITDTIKRLGLSDSLTDCTIGVDNLPAFLSEITTTEWNKSTGDKSIMKIVKASIVNELLKKAGNKQNGKV